MAAPYSIFDGFTVDETGKIVRNALVTVKTSGGDLVPLYQNRQGLASYRYPSGQLPNPLTSSLAGRVRFYTDPGEYKMAAKNIVTGADIFYDITIPDESGAAEYNLYENTIKDSLGNPVLDAQATVRLASGELADIFSDEGTTPLSNPLAVDETGAVSFYAANGRYKITAYSPTSGSEIFYDVLIPVGLLVEEGTLPEENRFDYYDNSSEIYDESSYLGTGYISISQVEPEYWIGSGYFVPNDMPVFTDYTDMIFGYILDDTLSNLYFILALEGSDGFENISISGPNVPSLNTLAAEYRDIYLTTPAWVWAVGGSSIPSAWLLDSYIDFDIGEALPANTYSFVGRLYDNGSPTWSGAGFASPAGPVRWPGYGVLGPSVPPYLTEYTDFHFGFVSDGTDWFYVLHLEGADGSEVIAVTGTDVTYMGETILSTDDATWQVVYGATYGWVWPAPSVTTWTGVPEEGTITME